MTHTKGPWIVKCPENDSNAFDVYSGPFKIHHGQWGGKANSYLIAAAPELLGWLKAVARQMQYERPNAEKVYTNGASGLFGMEENLLKIIAKAEGKEQ